MKPARASALRGDVLAHASEELAAPHAERAAGPVQIRLFEPVGYGIAERIRELKLDELRPIEALQLLAELQEELKRT